MRKRVRKKIIVRGNSKVRAEKKDVLIKGKNNNCHSSNFSFLVNTNLYLTRVNF